ncbi:FkbM family methyltransferase [Dyadobacter jejuensis]|uniref:FkbM family methyltransferase n=1 Tax=Dyadobacter jejuensis TaxID=1082580 RepID=A0A316ATD7_9BACT|nr:FkbM family methyltransferase [Dyadobacter jejuensis]PWJ60626.1 FkbM family methyltransferase [Dyadobacter jejuensis]
MKLSTLKTILSHPLNKNKAIPALFTFFKRGVAIRLHDYPMVYPFIENTYLVVEKGMSSAELQIYTGLYDTEEMLFLMHLLRPNDTFADVGANVGVYSVLAAGVCGAHTIAFEPIPSTFRRLERNITFNQLQKNATLHNLGVGDKEGTLTFTDSLDAINHVWKEGETGTPTRSVPVTTLDMTLPDTVLAAKIDVEGYEANVINGAQKTIANHQLKAIIIETNGLSEQYEFGQNYIHNQLIAVGFRPYNYSPSTRSLKAIDTPNPSNTIYLRDIPFIEQRLQTATKIKVKDLEF